MPRNELGDMRRSAVIMTGGPGAVVDFRLSNADGSSAPVSVVVAGLEEWDRNAPPAGLANPQSVFEERLQKKLRVNGFRLPPVDPDDDNPRGPRLLGVRFPTWLQCPRCSTIRPAGEWSQDAGNPALYCARCTAQAPGRRKEFVVPVRFITACEHGHIDDFPWHTWVGHRKDCNRSKPLRLISERAGLAGLFVICDDCGASRSLDGAFSREALEGLVRCRGRTPWLAKAPEACDQTPRVLQRGASNLYFPLLHSSLSIPPWSDSLQKSLGQFWAPIVAVKDAAQRAQFIGNLAPMLSGIGLSPAEIAKAVEDRLRVLEQVDPEDLRRDEWLQFTGSDSATDDPDDEFEARPVAVPADLQPYIHRLVQVVRLREVRAISAFTRINPPEPGAGDDATQLCRIQSGQLNWLPAVEIRGEGIFLSLDMDAVSVWESLPAVVNCARLVNERYAEDWKRRRQQQTPPRTIAARFLLIHSLAHALIRQLSLDCGYPTASLRERLYVSEGPDGMAGVLIYTGAPDAEGTLGGLVRQGLPDRFEPMFKAAVESVVWCSSDPLCSEGIMSASEACNFAACHSCLMLPETSCEEFNRFLDRTVLIGTPGDRNLGFFGLMASPV